jgi:hypothetical protein
MAKSTKTTKRTNKTSTNIAKKTEGTSTPSVTLASPRKEILGLSKQFNRTALLYGKKYLIRERILFDTPKEYAALNRSKSPSVDMPDISGLPYDEQRNRYDIGLTEDSREFLSIANSSEISAILASRKDILDAAIRTFGKDFQNSGTESAVMNNFELKFLHNRVINTSEPKNLLEVYAMLLGNKVAFKDELGEPRYKNASYIIECVDDVKSAEEQEGEEVFVLSSEWFPRMIKTDKGTLIAIMANINPSVREGMSDAALQKALNLMLRDRNQRARLLEYATNEESVELLKYEAVAKRAIQARIIHLENTKYSLGGVYLGTTPHAIGSLLSRPENAHLYDEIVDALARYNK